MTDHGSSDWSTGSVPAEQTGQFEADMDVCEERLGLGGPPTPPSEAEAARLYDILTGEIADCVRDLGYTVPELPSKQAYVEICKRRPCRPHYVPEADEPIAVYQEVRRACPVSDVAAGCASGTALHYGGDR